MKQRTFALLTILMLPLTLWAADGDTFTEATTESVTVTYTVINESAKTCKIGDGSNSAVDQSTSGTVTIPSQVNGYSVVAVAAYAFKECASIQTISIPTGITEIGGYAFRNCTALTTVNIPEGVSRLEDFTFKGCSSLDNVALPSSISYIGKNVFESCSSMSSISIPANAVIGVSGEINETFSGCTGLRNIVLGNGVMIYNKVFGYLQSLESITVGNSVGASSEAFSGRTYSNAKLYVPAGRVDHYSTTTPWNTTFSSIISIITFADANIKAVCVANWDTDGDGELSFDEAAAVTSLNNEFGGISDPGYTSFDELQYFTGLTSIGAEEFLNCSSLTSVVLPPNITSIGAGAFYSCPLTAITIPAKVTEIATELPAFNYSALENITVESGNTTYSSPEGSNAVISGNILVFGCKNTSIPTSVTKIGKYAFFNVSFTSTSISLPDGVTEIQKQAFAGSNISSINLDDLTDLTTIGSQAFYGCNGLYVISIPAGVTSIGSAAFANCEHLAYVGSQRTTPIQLDASDVFGGISSDAQLHIPADTRIAYISAGWNNGNVFQVVTEPYVRIETSVDGIYYILERESEIAKATVTQNPDKYSGEVSIPAQVTYEGHTYRVDEIAQNAFKDNNNLTKIELSWDIWSIGNGAFSGCDALLTVTVGNPTPVTIEENTFTNRANATLIVPVGSISTYKAATYWSQFATIQDTEGHTEDAVATVRTINVATAGTLSTLITAEEKNVITSLTLTGNLNGEDLRFLREMAGNSYDGNPTEGNLSYLDISGVSIVAGGNYLEVADGYIHIGHLGSKIGVNNNPFVSVANTLGDYVFAGCDKLETIKMPTGVVSIGVSTFYSCNLSTIVWPTTLTTIGRSAFWRNNFTSFTLPASVTSIENNIVAGCRLLTSLSVESENTVYDSRENCNAIIKTSTNTVVCGSKSATIPATVTSIGSGAFSWLGLTSIDIPNSVTSIGNEAFDDNLFTSVTIPANVTFIGANAFRFCDQLTSITVGASTPIAISEYTFTETNYTATLKVPVGSISAYKAADYWKNFATIQDVEGNTEDAVATVRTINVATAGTLSSLITAEEKNVITSLTLTGNLNGEDLRFLREMAGNDYNGLSTEGNLSYLDMSGAAIVAGGSYLNPVDGKIYLRTDKTSWGVSALDPTPLESEANVLGPCVFACCQKLETFKMPAGVVSIGHSAFDNSHNLSNITWPTALTTIEGAAFNGCDFTSFTLPASVTSIGNNIVMFNSNLAEISVASGNTVYDSREDCNAIIKTSTNELISGISTTVIPSTVTSIGNASFIRVHLTSVAIPDGVTSIGWSAFDENDFTEITIPANVTSIGERAFYECNNLETVTVGNSTPVAIEENTFTNRANATLIVPAGSISAYKAADYWKEFATIQDTEGNTEDAEVETERTINVETAGTLSTLITAEDKNVITNLTLTGSLNGEDLRFLREMAGSDYNGVPTDGNLSYLDMSGVTIVAGGNYVELVDQLIYYDKAKTMMSGGFSAAPQASEDNKLGNYVFAGCFKLETVIMPAGVVRIGDKAFAYSHLKDITWPTALTYIDREAFEFCNFTSFTLPAMVVVIEGTYNFLAGCFNLTELSVEEGNTVYDSRENCNAIIKTATNELVSGTSATVIPSTVTSIGDAAFRGLDMTSITIPEGVTSIGYEAFAGNAFTEITIPASVTSMSHHSFNCGTSMTVTVGNPTPITIESNTFNNNPTVNNTLIVPVGSISAYKAADYWKEFKTIQDTEGNTKDAEMASIKLNKSELAIKKEATEKLKATVSPSSLEDKTVTWKSSDTNIATVSKWGTVTGVNYGTATITCTSKATGASATCKVTVGNVCLNKSEFAIKKEATEKLKATVYPSSLDDKTVTWKSSDTKIATVSKWGTVTGVNYGTATITCTSKATGLKTTCKVTVGKVSLNKSELAIKKDATEKLKATVSPSSLEDKSVTWKSSDKNIATVSKWGTVTGVNYGTATITCTSKATGASTTCKVTVGNVSLNKSELAIKMGATEKLKATVYPSSLDDKTVTWKSSDTNIATVSKWGTVKGVNYGIATITCTSKATGLSTTCKVTVKKSSGTRSFEEDDEEVIGREKFEEKPFDVYDLRGRKVRHQVTSLDGLADGIYIVNGKKILKK